MSAFVIVLPVIYTSAPSKAQIALSVVESIILSIQHLTLELLIRIPVVAPFISFPKILIELELYTANAVFTVKEILLSFTSISDTLNIYIPSAQLPDTLLSNTFTDLESYTFIL